MDTDVVNIKALAFGHDCPQNPGIFIGQSHHRFLPAAALSQALCPLRNRVGRLSMGQHHGLGTLNQQCA